MKKKLSDITEADALEVANLFYPGSGWYIHHNDSIYVIVQCQDYRIYIWKTGDDFIDFEELYTGKENIEAHGGESEPCSPYLTIIDIIDYLRHQGYDLPNKFEKNYTEKDLLNTWDACRIRMKQWEQDKHFDDAKPITAPDKKEYFKDNFGIIIEK